MRTVFVSILDFAVVFIFVSVFVLFYRLALDTLGTLSTLGNLGRRKTATGHLDLQNQFC